MEFKEASPKLLFNDILFLFSQSLWQFVNLMTLGRPDIGCKLELITKLNVVIIHGVIPPF